MSLALRTFASLRNPNYRRYFTGHVTSVLGFWLRLVVQGWLVYELTGSRALLGVVTAAGLLPLAVFSNFGGLIADRVDRRKLLLWLPAVAVLANVALGVLVLAGAITVGHIIAASVLVGTARAVEIPVRNAFVRDLVGMQDLGNAIALNAAGFNVARVLGPALGALLLALLGIGPCLLIAAAANGAMIVAVAGIHGQRPQGSTPRGSPLRQVAEGFRYVRGHRRTRTLMLLLAISLIFMFTYQTLLPAFAKDRLGLGKSGYSLLTAVPGLGALIGALWVAGRSGLGISRRGVVFGMVWFGALCVFVLGLTSHIAIAIPFLLGAGFCQVGFMATANGLVQESVPDALRGRVMGIWTFVFGLGFPIGGLVMGAVSQLVDITTAWSGGAVLTVLLSLFVRLRLPPRNVVEAEAAKP